MLTWDPTVTARLRGLHESGRVELQWLTTWTERADELLAEPMGLPRGLRTHGREGVLSTGFSGELRGVSGWWKLAAARAVAEAEPGRRIVWIDDDLAEQAADTSEWLAVNGQVLVVAPDFVRRADARGAGPGGGVARGPGVTPAVTVTPAICRSGGSAGMPPLWPLASPT